MPEVVENKKTGVILENETDQCLADALMFMSIRENTKKMLSFIKEKLKDYTVQEQAKSFGKMYLMAIENNHR